jgi:hypothetical protein
MREEEKASFVEEELLPIIRKANPAVADAWFETEGNNQFVYIQFVDETITRVQVSGGTDCMIYEAACALRSICK